MLFTKSDQHYIASRARKLTLLEHYKTNMFLFLSKMYPNVNHEKIRVFIDSVVKDRFKDRGAKLLYQESEGNISVESKSLFGVINNIGDLIYTPYGSTFLPKSIKESIFVGYINKKQKARKVVKKDEIEAQMMRDAFTARSCFNTQLNIKIDINALTGIMVSNVFFHSPISYNSITAMARTSIMVGYGFIELMSEGNMVFKSENDAINFVVCVLREYPGDSVVMNTVKKYDLSEPTTDEVIEYLTKNLSLYNKFGRKKNLKKLIGRLSKFERCFVFYACNLRNLFEYNKHLVDKFKSILAAKDIDPVPESDTRRFPELADESLKILTIVIQRTFMNDIPLKTIFSDHRDIERKMIAYYDFLETQLSYFEELFDVLTMVKFIPSDLTSCKQMLRETTILSDTDSVIFTTVNWLKLFMDDELEINEQSYDYNALMVFLFSKVFYHVFAYLSASVNISKEDIHGIDIKNEYLYVVFIRTIMAKHYAGLMKFREGAILNPLKFDFKGKNFIGSDIAPVLKDKLTTFVRDILYQIINSLELSVSKILEYVIRLELEIERSINNNELTYFNPVSINTKDSYDDPMITGYFYYTLWKKVFDDGTSEVVLPYKFIKVPVKQITPKTIGKGTAYYKKFPDEAKKILKFMKEHKRSKLDFLMTPTEAPIPEAMFHLIHMKNVIYSTCYPFYLFLKSLDITNTSSKRKVLFMDLYPEIAANIREESK